MAKGLWPVINVSNIDKSVEFYKGLGLRTKVETMGPMRWGSVNMGDAGLVIWQKDQIPEDAPADTRAWVSGELGKGVMFSIGVPNARKAWEKATALRVDVDSPLKEQEWGGWEFTVVDPDGYVVNVTDKFPGASSSKPKKKAAGAAKRGAKKKAPAKKRR